MKSCSICSKESNDLEIISLEKCMCNECLEKMFDIQEEAMNQSIKQLILTDCIVFN